MTSPTPSTSPEISAAERQRIFIVENYWFHQRSCEKVRTEWRKAGLPRSELPDNKDILRLVDKFDGFGTVKNINKGRSGRSSAITPELKETVEDFFAENPTSSTRRASAVLQIPRTTLRRIMKKELKLYPYKIQMFQELTEYDAQRRLAFANNILSQFEDDLIDPGKIWFTDEAHFWMSGYVNKQNYRWAKENPRIGRSTSMKPQRVTAWCAISSSGVIGPFFFEQNVTGSRYRDMLESEFIPTAQGMGCVRGWWFMQDGARPHRTTEVFDYLDEHFSGRVIGLDYESRYGGGMDWPLYSPDLNPCDFFLWGYLKDRIYRNEPSTIEDLKAKIVQECHTISVDTFSKVIGGFKRRLAAVIEQEGLHVEKFHL